MDIKLEFSKRLKECLADKWPNLTQKQKAEMLGIKQATLSEWLTAKKMPGLEKLIEISLIMNVTIDWLGTGRGQKHPSKEHVFDKLTTEQIKSLKNILNDICKETTPEN